MHKEVLSYLDTQQVGVLAVAMLDGSPHGATVRFAYQSKPFRFFFITTEGYKKTEPLLKNDVTKGSFVVGVNEDDMRTFQSDGEITLLKPEEQEHFDEVYYGKFPEERGKEYGAPSVFFTFTPIWWRFTDWTAPEGKTVYTSDE